jgi:hypothetical protein
MQENVEPVQVQGSHSSESVPGLKKARQTPQNKSDPSRVGKGGMIHLDLTRERTLQFLPTTVARCAPKLAVDACYILSMYLTGSIEARQRENLHGKICWLFAHGGRV